MPVHQAAYNGHIKVVRLLTKSFKSPPDSKDVAGYTEGYTLLLLACEGGHLDIVEYLTNQFECDVKARRKQSQDTALHLACISGRLELVQYLVLAHKADVKAENEDGNSPIHVCTNQEIMRYLLNSCDIHASIKGSNGI